MKRRPFVLAALVAAALAPAVASAQVALPATPSDLISMANATEYKSNLAHRAFVNKTMDYVKAKESTLSSKPFTDAIQNWFFGRYANEGQFRNLVDQQVAASNTSLPIDLYLLMGQSNMVGVTETYPPRRGPDLEIQSDIQAAAGSGRKVATLNCAVSGTHMAFWHPDTVSLSAPLIPLMHNPMRECVEVARSIRNTLGKGARIKGVFFYQGESDAIAALGTDTISNQINTWPQRYIDMVEFLRTEFGDVPAVHAQLAAWDSSNGATQANWTSMQSKQATVTSSLTKSAMITTNNLALVPPTQAIPQKIHLTNKSQCIAGHLFATAMLNLMNGTNQTPNTTSCNGL
jgi:hypothetical protein